MPIVPQTFLPDWVTDLYKTNDSYDSYGRNDIKVSLYTGCCTHFLSFHISWISYQLFSAIFLLFFHYMASYYRSSSSCCFKFVNGHYHRISKPWHLLHRLLVEVKSNSSNVKATHQQFHLNNCWWKLHVQSTK